MSQKQIQTPIDSHFPEHRNPDAFRRQVVMRLLASSSFLAFEPLNAISVEVVLLSQPEETVLQSALIRLDHVKNRPTYLILEEGRYPCQSKSIP